MNPKIDDFECCELAAHLLDMEGEDYDLDDVWGALYEQHEIDEDGFCWLINQLVPLIDVGKSPLTGNLYKGFSKELAPGLKEWLVKMEIKGAQA